jgi:hypothetical protein
MSLATGERTPLKIKRRKERLKIKRGEEGSSFSQDQDPRERQPRLTGADTAVSIGSDRDGLSGALTASLTLSMINKAVGLFQSSHYARRRGQPPRSLRLAAAHTRLAFDQGQPNTAHARGSAVNGERS